MVRLFHRLAISNNRQGLNRLAASQNQVVFRRLKVLSRGMFSRFQPTLAMRRLISPLPVVAGLPSDRGWSKF